MSTVISAPEVAEVIDRAAEPRQVRLVLTRLLDVHPGLADRLGSDRLFVSALVALIDASRSLSEAVIADVGLLAPVDDPDGLAAECPQERYTAGARRAVEDDAADPGRGLRRWKRRELLRIAVRDLLGFAELPAVGRELAALAEGCLQAALSLAVDGEPRIAVVGMGKLGGREIDYGSDLDLIFVYDAHEEARSAGGPGGAIDLHDYYVRLGQKLITFLTAPMEEGLLYRIDMRLRPSGRVGPIVSSLAAFRHYHATSSELWERQALVKLRAAAGDFSLGNDAEEVARGFAYGKGLTDEGVAMIDHLRTRMENELAKESAQRFNLKKGMGGLVDIEFLTQMLQLKHGGARRRIQTQGTLDALKALDAERLLTPAEYRVLSEGYLFLRRLDHRLRLERNESLDVLERDPARLQQTALGLGYEGKKDNRAGKRLLEDYEKLRNKIRRCYEKRFRNAAAV